MTYAIAPILAALGDDTRRKVFELVAVRPRPVSELAAQLPVSRPAVSQHLKVLKAAGLLTDQPDGVRRIYRLDPRGVGAMRSWLDVQWTDALAAFRAYAEADAAAGSDESRGDEP